MEVTTYSNFRKNLKGYMKNVNDDSDTLIVTSQDNNDVVVMSKSDYDSIMETLYLLNDKSNRRHLERSMTQIESGKAVEISIEDL